MLILWTLHGKSASWYLLFFAIILSRFHMLAHAFDTLKIPVHCCGTPVFPRYSRKVNCPSLAQACFLLLCHFHWLCQQDITDNQLTVGSFLLEIINHDCFHGKGSSSWWVKSQCDTNSIISLCAVPGSPFPWLDDFSKPRIPVRRQLGHSDANLVLSTFFFEFGLEFREFKFRWLGY